ncbi:MAG TPA: S1/P1 nuclease [Bryobacteraceae bacterium]|nr:S1/P1 nuclease [Bryobacteraceae bacterium]
MRTALPLLIALTLSASSAWGWGCDGHQIIALIARAHLTPAASAAVDRLLRENPVDPSLNRFCKDHPNDLMADAATWADDERTVARTTEDWHYIDIPLAVPTGSVPESDAMKWCPKPPGGSPGCVVAAIDYERLIVIDRARSAADRTAALRYLIHFIGDIAQPLHDVENRDHGGNCTSMTFFSSGKPQNLHSIWDSQLIVRDLEMTNANDAQYARKLDESFGERWPQWGESGSAPRAWAWEGHKLAGEVAYGSLKPQIPVESATAEPTDQDACNAERDKVAALHILIDDAYAAQAMPVIREQLAKAGYRLAGLLNQTFR